MAFVEALSFQRPGSPQVTPKALILHRTFFSKLGTQKRIILWNLYHTVHWRSKCDKWTLNFSFDVLRFQLSHENAVETTSSSSFLSLVSFDPFRSIEIQQTSQVKAVLLHNQIKKIWLNVSLECPAASEWIMMASLAGSDCELYREILPNCQRFEERIRPCK